MKQRVSRADEAEGGCNPNFGPRSADQGAFGAKPYLTADEDPLSRFFLPPHWGLKRSSAAAPATPLCHTLLRCLACCPAHAAKAYLTYHCILPFPTHIELFIQYARPYQASADYWRRDCWSDMCQGVPRRRPSQRDSRRYVSS